MTIKHVDVLEANTWRVSIQAAKIYHAVSMVVFFLMRMRATLVQALLVMSSIARYLKRKSASTDHD